MINTAILPDAPISPAATAVQARGLHAEAAPTLAPERARMNVLVQDLDDADIAKLATFLRIGQDRLSCEWKIVFKGEVQLLLFGGSEPRTVFGMLDSPAQTLRVGDAEARDAMPQATLTRPLQYEAFIDMLLQVERARAGAKPDESPIEPPQSEAPHAPAPGSVQLSPGDRYRLRRWPAADLLHSARETRRVANFLLTRHIDLVDLAQYSRVDAPQCEALLRTLIAAGLIDVKPPHDSPPPSRPTAPAASPAASRDLSTESGLFGRIRRRLGLS